MALPTSGSISIAMIATELGVALPLDLNDSRVRTLAGKPTGNITIPTDLYGKSNITLGINTSNSIGGAGSFRYTTITATISKIGGGAITAYNWVIESDTTGGLSFTSARNVATAAFQGPAYETKGFNTNATASIGCTVTVDGTNYYRSAEVYYRVGTVA